MKYKQKPQRFRRIIIPFLSLLVLTAISYVGWQIYDNQPDPQPTLKSPFVDLEKIEKISKFRSCQGHTVVPQNSSEARRNMKHYVVLKEQYFGGNKVSVYAPFDGIVKSIGARPKHGLEGEIWLGNPHNDWDFSIQHLYVSSNLKEGEDVKSGQIIGTVADRGLDIVYGVGAKEVEMIEGYQSPYSNLDSVFNHIDKKLLTTLRQHGINQKNMSDTKDFRDKNPCKLEGSSGAQLNDYDHPEDWVILN